MSLNGSLGLGVTLSANDLASGVIQIFGKNLQNAAGTAQQAAASISSGMKTAGAVVLGAGIALGGGLAAMANVSGQFEEAIAAVGAVSGASAVELKSLTDAAINAGIATQFSPKQAAVGLGDLAQAGYSAKESIELLRPVLDLAAGSLGKLDPSKAAGLASQTLKAFQIDAGQASVVVDKLLQSMNASALSAEELPLAMGVASRGAQVMRQSLDETLISLGLVRNLIPSVERASTAVAVAMERMVNPKHAGQLRAIGVQVADAQGKFRPFLSIIEDMIPAMSKMTDQKQAGFLEHTFGAEALGGIQAIMTQVTGGIKKQTGETVKGAEAIAYLRDQFANSAGTAKAFADKMLDTYEGQKKLVKGSIETLAILAGDPLRKAFRPFVEGFLAGINKVIETVRAMPDGTKTAFAKVAIAISVIAPVVGVLLLVGGAAIGLVLKLMAMGTVLGTVALALGPVGIALALVVAGMAALHTAYVNDVGGFGSFVRDTVRQAKVAWDGLVQVFTQGGFSGAVREELNRAENKGVKEFVIGIYTWVGRIKNFFSGLGDGFSSFIGKAEPVIREFVTALGEAQTAIFGITENGIDHGDTYGKWERFGEIGRKVGDVIGRVAVFAVRAATALIRVGVAGYEMAGPFIDVVGEMLASVRDFYGEIVHIGVELGLLDETADKTGTGLASAFKLVAGVVLGVVGFIAGAVTSIGNVIRSLISIVSGVMEIIVGIFTGNGEMIRTGFLRIFYGIASLVVNVFLGIIRSLAGMVDMVLSGIPGWNNKLGNAVAGWQKGAEAGLKSGFQLDSPEDKRAAAVREAQSAYHVDNAPAVVAATQLTSDPGYGGMSDAAEALRMVAERPVQVTVPVQIMTPDNEVLASMVAQGQTASGVRGGLPVG